MEFPCFEERLAVVVKSLPILYDKTLPDFKNKFKRQNAWSEVALKLGLPSEKEAETRFTNLRSRYTREKRKKLIQIHMTNYTEGQDSPVVSSKLDYQGASGSDAYPFMSFLDPYINSRRTRGNADSNVNQIQERNGNYIKMEENSDQLVGGDDKKFVEKFYSDEEQDDLENSESELDDKIIESFENCDGSTIVYLPGCSSKKPHCNKIVHEANKQTVQCSPPHSSKSREFQPNKKKRKRVDSLLDFKVQRCINECMKSYAQQNVQSPSTKDEDELFGLMVGVQLRGMTSEQKMIAKHHITSVINQVRMPGVVITGEVRIPSCISAANQHQPTTHNSLENSDNENVGDKIDPNGDNVSPVVSNQ